MPAGTIVLHGGTAVVGHGRSFSRKRRRRPVHPPGGRGDRDDDDTVATTGEDDSFLASTRADWFHSRAGGGVTQLAWAPSASSNPHVLFSASRRSDAVLSWDVRAMSGLDASGNDRGRGRGGRRPLCGGLRSYSRGNGDNGTNQRLEFELDDVGRRMFVGSNDEGLVRVYDVSSGRLEGILDVIDDNGVAGDGGGAMKKDAVNGLSYFCNGSGRGGGGAGGKYGGLLAVAVGSRRYDNLSDDDNYDYDDGGVDRVRRVRECPPGCLQLHGLNISDA